MRFQSKRLRALPAYAAAGIAARKRELMAAGRDVIDVSIGDTDHAPPQIAVEALMDAVRDPKMSRYPHQVGLVAFREAVARYMDRRFGVRIDPMTEVLPLIGSKEGLAHLALAVLDPGDVCVVPEPGYPAYLGGARLANADPEIVPLRRDRDFLVELGEIPSRRRARAGLVYLNYPNNPTGAIAPVEYLTRTLECCREDQIVLAYDNPYCEITFDGYRAPSILELEGARDLTIEFHSLSKSAGMTGWRVGWAVGNSALIAALAKTKSWIDTGVFLGVQQAAAAVLDASDDVFPPVRERYARRRDAMVSAFEGAGMEVDVPRAGMYLWISLPDGVSDTEFTARALEEESLAVLPGSALGPGGAGYVRVALAVEEERLREVSLRVVRTLDSMSVKR